MARKLFDKKHNQFVLNKLAEQGIEMTTEELIETRKKAMANIRKGLEERGFKNLPESDEELFLLVKKYYKPK